MTKEELEKLAEVIIHHDLIVISDEIYAELTYDGVHASVTSLRECRSEQFCLTDFPRLML